MKPKKSKEISLDNLVISIDYVCPNTGKTVHMTSKNTYDSPIKYNTEVVTYSSYTSDQFSWIEITKSCPECGLDHTYDL